jgi:uncharacterized membrane protein YphA (DoxX/SURF4 family)
MKERIESVLPHIARIALGLSFVVFGLNYFLHFLPTPAAQLSPRALGFLGGLAGTGYIFPLIKSIEVAAGVMLLAGFVVPFALVLLAPIIVNIVLFHTVLASPNPVVLGILAAELYLAWVHREAFRPLFARKRPAPRRVERAARTDVAVSPRG